MTHAKTLAEHVTFLLRGKGAHSSPEAVLDRWPAALRGERPPGAEHSPWELLEHLRIAQRDILDYSRGPGHASPEWPDGYWPGSAAPPHDAAWQSGFDALQE